MNITLNVRGSQITIPIPEGVVADPKLLDGGHPLYYVVKNRKQTETYVTKVCELLSDLPKELDVLELCAGIGLIAKANWDALEPKSWTGVELDANCEALVIEPRMKFIIGDMYTTNIPPSMGLVVCEFSNNTLPKMWREPKRAALLRQIANAQPRYWYIADVGYYWIHLANHWPIYQERFGVQVSRENYHELFDKFMRETYGYKVIKWTVGGGAQYLLLEAV
jgi:hypothetical protein